MIGWRIWYRDAVYDSREFEWADVPDDGIQVLYIYKDDGRREGMSGQTSYYLVPDEDGDYFDSDMDRPVDVIKRYPEAVIKRGKRIPLNVFENIQREACEYDWFSA